MDADTDAFELPSKVVEFTESVKQLYDAVSELRGQTSHQICEQLEPLDKAKHELAYLYALNSIYWTLLVSSGKDAQAHDIKTEISRVQGLSARIREIEDSRKRKVDATVAKRLIKNSLWNNAQQSSSTNNSKDSNQPKHKREKRY